MTRLGSLIDTDDMTEAPEDQVLATIQAYPDQEVHLRRRTAPSLPTVLEVSQYNLQGGGYRLATPLPDTDEVVLSLAAALLRTRDDQKVLEFCRSLLAERGLQ